MLLYEYANFSLPKTIVRPPARSNRSYRLRFARTHETLLNIKSLNNSQHLLVIDMIKTAVEALSIRYESSDKYNALIASNEIDQHAPLSDEAKNLITLAAERLA